MLKLSTYHKKRGDTTEYVRGKVKPKKQPDLIYVTSLFTFAWRPVHEAVKFYKSLYPKTPIILGGIYASLMPKHAKKSGADKIHKGLFLRAENLMPDYSLIPEWNGSIIFSSRGCIRKCKFCAVPKLEGKPKNLLYSIRHLVYPRHTKIILWDNNILACKNWRDIFDELTELGLDVDFNQGIDARLITDEVAEKLTKIKFKHLRLAYDNIAYQPMVKKAIEILKSHGINGRRVIVYTLFNFEDSPEDFLERVKDLLNWGVCCYPMKYRPLNTLEKNSFVAPKWTKEELEMVESARRVMGFAGTFPPYEGLVRKLSKTDNFYQAFKLRKKQHKHNKENAPKKGRTLRCNGSLDWRVSLSSVK